MERDEIADRLEAFIRKRFHVSEQDASFTRAKNLWEHGYVDSIGLLELVGFIERTFGVALPDEALFDPAFTHVDGMAGIVSALPLRSASGSPSATRASSPAAGA